MIPAILRARLPTLGEKDKHLCSGIAFKSEEGTKYSNTAWLRTNSESRIQNCEDWQVVWDEDKCPAMFPPEIVTTSRRPDITIYSPTEKQGIVIELTVPAEENLAQANLRKKLKYEDLIQDGHAAGWELKYFPVEVGSRGMINSTLRACFKFLGLTKKEIKKGLDSIARTALRATYTLWLARNSKTFGNWELVQRPHIPPVIEVEEEE